MTITRALVLEALSRVRDPETQVPITKSGQLKLVNVNAQGLAEVIFRPVSPYVPLALVVKLALDIALAISSIEGADKLTITVEEHPLRDYINRSLAKLFETHWPPPPISARG